MRKIKTTVHKFGGSSLKNAQSYQYVATLITGKDEAIVLSAAAQTTALLQELLDLATSKQAIDEKIQEIEHFQNTLIQGLLEKAQQNTLFSNLKNDLATIRSILLGISVVSDFTESMRNTVLGFGELWSARLMTEYLKLKLAVCFLDAREVLFVEHHNGITNIDWERSQKAFDKFIKDKDYDVLIIPGFIATTLDGKQTTLGLNGSDFSAAIFSKLLDAELMIKWTDVDGVHSADPRIVSSAFPIKSLSYEEALELAYFGANIIHPRAIYPVVKSQIPIVIKNVNNPEFPGTYISKQRDKTGPLVCGLTSIDHIALINIEGSGMIGVSGVAARVFQTLHHVGISVILISQSSSEHSICFAVASSQSDLCVKVLKEHFAYQIEQQRIADISAMDDCAILAVVGDNMVGTPGIAGKLFKMLAKSNINIRAISQGSSERNISLVIQRDDINRALRVVHGGFYLSNKTISIGLIGPGGVGKNLLTQLNKSLEELKKKYAVNLRVRGIMNSKIMLLDNHAIDLKNWKKSFEGSTSKADFTQFAEHIVADDIPHAVLIDCTASQEVSDYYQNFVKKGLHIVTPNKKANSGDLDFYKTLKQLAKQQHRYYLYETTVCAGLPVIKTLQDLIQTGDEEIKIEGIVSGTLAYIFDELSKGDRFSEVVFRAHKLGYTEPDPRDDLSGTDVARKFTCLARELGFDVLLDEINVLNLVPEGLRKVSKDEFFKRLPDVDDEMENLMKSKLKLGEKLCYVGSIDTDGKVNVDMQAYPSNHPFYNLKGTDNIIIFTTKRYHDFPLVVSGPGAGTEVTAAGVFADLLRLLSFL